MLPARQERRLPARSLLHAGRWWPLSAPPQPSLFHWRNTGKRREPRLAAADVLFPDDPKQTQRIRQYLIAVGTSVLVWALLFLLCWEGYLEETGLVHVTGAMLFFFGLFYALFRSGLNLRFRDPSLTTEMMESPIVVLTWAMYYATPAGRGVIILMLPFIFLSGLFRLGTRDLLG